MKLISIIIPVYKTESHLRKCVDSVLTQTYHNLEIILVDDGSPDNCGVICDAYQIKDKRVKVIHKTNGGQSTARNMGLDIAKGEYIGFIDSDDWVEADMYSNLINDIETTDADIACCGIKRSNETTPNIDPFKTIWNAEEALVHSLKRTYFGVGPCNKLYKRQIFDELRFPEGMVFEDLQIIAPIFSRCKKVSYNSVIGYHYFMNENGTIATATKVPNYDIFVAIQNTLGFIKKHFADIYPDVLLPTLDRAFYYVNRCNNKEFTNALRVLTRQYFWDILGCRAFSYKLKIARLLFALGINFK